MSRDEMVAAPTAVEGARAATSWPAVLSLIGAGVAAALQIGKGTAALLGWFGQALGFRRQVQLGLMTIVAMNLAGAAAGSAGWLLAARIGEGLGFVLVVLAAPALLPAVSAPEQRRLVIGTWGIYMPLGAGVATL